MFFSDIDIKNAMENGDLVIKPFDKDCLTPVGYDVRVGSKAYIINEDGTHKLVDIDADGELRIDGKSIALIGTLEHIELSGALAGTIHSKVSIVSRGLSHISTTIDPGWKGQFLIQIHNHLKSPQILELGETFCTLVFYILKTPTDKPHNKPPFRVDISKHIDSLMSERLAQAKTTEALPGLEELLRKWNEIDDKLEERRVDKVIMMTDEVESVKRQDTLKDKKAAAYTVQQRGIIRSAVADYDGIAEETGGDGMISAFNTNDSEKAIHAAVEIQRKLEERNAKYTSDEQKLFIRIGIDKGKIFVEGGKPQQGLMLSRTQRIMSKAAGGHIYISEPVHNEVHQMKQYRFHSKGAKRLKGLAKKVQIYEVIWK